MNALRLWFNRLCLRLTEAEIRDVQSEMFSLAIEGAWPARRALVDYHLQLNAQAQQLRELIATLTKGNA